MLALACAGLALTAGACADPSTAGAAATGWRSAGASESPVPKAVSGLGSAPTTAPARKPVDAGIDPGADPVFGSDPDLARTETYAYRHTEPGDHALPAGTVTLRYDVSTALDTPLKALLDRARADLVQATGVAVYLDGGHALNDADLAAIQSLHKPPSQGGQGATRPTRLYVYNLKTLAGGTECTPTSSLACAGQTARGGRSPYLWHNGWWDSWVKHLTLDDLEEVKAGAFSNTGFESVSLKAVRSIGPMGFGHRPYAKLSVLYLPSVTYVGPDAFRRNQYLTKVNLPRATKVDDFAFDDASRLRYFNAPRLRSIGRNALNDSHALVSVNLPSVEYIGINCFDLNGNAEAGTGVRVLRLPKLTVLDKNGLTGFASLVRVYAPSLTTAWHDAITRNPSLAAVYVPEMRKLGPRAFRDNPNLREVRFGDRPPAQDADVFAGADPARLSIYHSGDAASWARFVPAGNPTVPVLRYGG
ncbi:hypothetical protein GCM10023263_03890 [Phytohabitans rumicis]